MAFCSYWEPDPCFGSSVTNSIAAGCVFGGFVAPGHDCGDTSSTKFKDNVAHSIDGCGAYIYPDPASDGHSECYEGSHFSAYKAQESGIATHYKSQEIRMRDMVFIDNQEGISL